MRRSAVFGKREVPLAMQNCRQGRSKAGGKIRQHGFDGSIPAKTASSGLTIQETLNKTPSASSGKVTL